MERFMTLFNIGAVAITTAGFTADGYSRTGEGSTASKAVMGRLDVQEPVGEGGETFSITGQLLPYHQGGLRDLQTLENYRKSGQAIPVMRGDGLALGYYTVQNVNEKHAHLSRQGVGYALRYSVQLKKAQPVFSANIVSQLIGLFR
jgi:phage protein U